MPSTIDCLLSLWAFVPFGPATDFVVAPSGGDFTAIQAALDVAFAGDRVLVEEKAGGYHEKLVFPRSGSAGAGPSYAFLASGQRLHRFRGGLPQQLLFTLDLRFAFAICS